MNTPVWLGEYIYIYNFDAGEALQFPSLDGLVDYINDSNPSFTIYKSKEKWLAMANNDITSPKFINP